VWIQIEFKPGGKELAKVLHFYGLLEGDSEFKIICPFHNDINASLLINLIEGNFYCFGCGASGDALTFVKYLNKQLNDLEACKLYFKILKSNKVRKFRLNRIKKIKHKPTNLQALVEASDYYYGLLTIDWENDDSLEKKYMQERGFSPSSLKKCKAKLTYNAAYPLIFPMLDLGEFKGWVCRTTSKLIEKRRKYLYNTGFSRRNTIVGDYKAETVVIVEGYMDWLKMRQLGLKKVGAILGWKITEAQVEKLKKQGVKTIISALDNDICGRKGTRYLKKFFNVIRFQFPSSAKDPGDLTKEQFLKAREKTKRKFRRI